MADWKHVIRIKHLLSDGDVTNERAREVAAGIAKEVDALMSKLGDGDAHYMLDEVHDMMRDAENVSDVNDALNVLYDVGDEFMIWVA